MTERTVDGVSLSILALVGAQVLVLGGESPIVGGILRGSEADLRLVLRDVHQVVGIAVAIHVVGVDVAVAGIAHTLVEQAEVVVGQIGVAHGSHHTVRQVVAGVVEDVEVRAIHGRNVPPGGGGVGTRHTGDLLADGVRVGGGDVEPLDRRGVQGDGRHRTVTLAGVGQHVSVDLVVLVIRRIDMTLVSTVERTPAGVVGRNGVVAEHHAVDGLVVDELTRDGEREGHGNVILRTSYQQQRQHQQHLNAEEDEIENSLNALLATEEQQHNQCK